jgi:hypothetical protein
MAEDEGGREGSQGPAKGGTGEGEHGSWAAAAHGSGGAGVAEAAARQGLSFAVQAELRAGRCLHGSPEEKEKAEAGHGRGHWRRWCGEISGELGQGGGGFAKGTAADEEKRMNTKGYMRG